MAAANGLPSKVYVTSYSRRPGRAPTSSHHRTSLWSSVSSTCDSSTAASYGSPSRPTEALHRGGITGLRAALDVESSRSDVVSECASRVVPDCSGLLRASQIHGVGMACLAELLPPRPRG